MKPDLSLSPCPHTKAGFHYLEIGNHLHEAGLSFDQAMKDCPENNLALAGKAIVLRAEGDLSGCLEMLDSILTQDRQNIYALHQRCLSRARMTNDTTFIDDLIKLASLTPNEAGAALDVLNRVAANSSQHMDKWLQQDKEALAALLCCLDNEAAQGNPQASSSRIATTRLFLNLFLDRTTETTALVPVALNPEEEPYFCENIYTVSMALSRTRIGDCRMETLKAVIGALSEQVDTLLRMPLTQTDFNSVLSLAALIRLPSLGDFLAMKNMAWQSLEDHTLIHCFLFNTPSITYAFNSGPKPPASDVFKSICFLCFTSPTPDEVRRRLEASELTERLIQLPPVERGSLMASIHQAHYNIYISGNLATSHQFSAALASLQKTFTGSYDSFFDGKERYLGRDWVSAFGHLLYLDLLLNAEAAGIGPEIPRTVRCTKGDAANEAVFDLLEANGFTIELSQEADAYAAGWQMDYVATPDQRVEHFLDFCNEAQAEQIARRQAPFLSLPEPWQTAGARYLLTQGINSSAKVAAIHMREAAYWTNLHNHFMASRNVDPATYIPAINYLLDEGYHVIRLGDPSMTPLPQIKNKNFTDLTRVVDKPAYLDFYILARSNLYIGTTSGPNAVANMFGASCLVTNWIPMHVHIPNTSGQALIMPKLIETVDGPASLADMLRDPFSCSEILLNDALGRPIKLLDNSAEEILSAVGELTKRHENRFEPTDKTQTLEASINDAWRRFMPWDLKMPHSFIETYGSVLLGDNSP